MFTVTKEPVSRTVLPSGGKRRAAASLGLLMTFDFLKHEHFPTTVTNRHTIETDPKKGDLNPQINVTDLQTPIQYQ